MYVEIDALGVRIDGRKSGVLLRRRPSSRADTATRLLHRESRVLTRVARKHVGDLDVGPADIEGFGSERGTAALRFAGAAHACTQTVGRRRQDQRLSGIDAQVRRVAQ